MKLWAITLSEDERTVLSAGLSPSVSTPLIDASVGQFIALFPNEANALLYTKGVVDQGLFRAGEYTLYEVTGIPLDSAIQEIRVRFDNPNRLEAHMIVLMPPKLPAQFIRYVKRKMIQ